MKNNDYKIFKELENFAGKKGKEYGKLLSEKSELKGIDVLEDANIADIDAQFRELMNSEKVKLGAVEPRGFYDRVIEEEGEIQSKIDMKGWKLQAEKQALEKKIAEAKKKSQKANEKPFKGQKRKRVEMQEKVEKEEKPKKSFKQKKLSFFFKKG